MQPCAHHIDVVNADENQNQRRYTIMYNRDDKSIDYEQSEKLLCDANRQYQSYTTSSNGKEKQERDKKKLRHLGDKGPDPLMDS